MLARIAHELYWIGRRLARAEHTSRMLDGVFHADLQGRPDDPAGVRLSWDALLTIVSGEPPETSAGRDQVLRLLTLDPDHPTSVLNCVNRRSVPAPPNAGPVARFLVFERDYPDSVAFSIEALHNALTAADPSYRSSPAVLRLSQMIADLDFRARAAVDAGLADTLGDVQQELAHVDADIAHRYFGGPVQPVRARRRMNFAIRYLTDYRYDSPITDNLNALRVKPATMATQSVEDFVVRVDPESRLNQHLDYFGTTVIEFGISRPHEHLSIAVRARVKTTAPEDPPESAWTAIEEPRTRPPPANSCSRPARSRTTSRSRTWSG